MHGVRRPSVAGMGDFFGLDLMSLQQMAEWVGIEIGEEELFWIEAFEDEWKASRKVIQARFKGNAGDEGE
jgi:hypothetical protein